MHTGTGFLAIKCKPCKFRSKVVVNLRGQCLEIKNLAEKYVICIAYLIIYPTIYKERWRHFFCMIGHHCCPCVNPVCWTGSCTRASPRFRSSERRRSSRIRSPGQCSLGTSDFDSRMSGIKNSEVRRKSTTFFQKIPFSEIPYWVVACIFGLFSSLKVHIDLTMRRKLFSLIRSNVVSKNLSSHTDFKNVHMTFVKSAPKKSFAQKTDFFRSLANFQLVK